MQKQPKPMDRQLAPSSTTPTRETMIATIMMVSPRTSEDVRRWVVPNMNHMVKETLEIGKYEKTAL